MERTSGEAEGLTIAEYTEKYGKAPWTDWANPLSPGGESGVEFSTRVMSAINRVAEEGRGRDHVGGLPRRRHHGDRHRAVAGRRRRRSVRPLDHSACQPDELLDQ